MRCLPIEKRAKPSPEWNHYRVTCKDGTIKLEVNGKEVSGAGDCVPRKGYHLPGGRGLGVPLPQPPDQGDARHRRDPGRDGDARRGLRLAVLGPRPARLAVRPGPRGPLAGEGLDPRLRRQEHGEGQGPLDREELRRLHPDRRLAAPRQADAAAAPGRAPERRRGEGPRRQDEDARDPLCRRQRHPAPRPGQGAGEYHLQHHRLGRAVRLPGGQVDARTRSAPGRSPRSRPTPRSASGTGS